MKIKFFVFAGLLLINGIFSNVKAQVVEQGNIMVDVFYGFPNLWSKALKTAYDQTGSDVVMKSSAVGPFGCKIEYMMSDKIGLGLIVNYANSTVKWSENTVDLNNSPITYNYDISLPRFRIMPAFNLHFYPTDKLDPYWVIAAGYGSFNAKIKTNDPNFEETDIKGLIPIAFRTGIGTRYFFTDNIGANFEIGFSGGPLLQLGLSCKL